MITDIERAQAAHPEVTHVVLCGGKDSLNMLLLPWRRPRSLLSRVAGGARGAAAR